MTYKSFHECLADIKKRQAACDKPLPQAMITKIAPRDDDDAEAVAQKIRDNPGPVVHFLQKVLDSDDDLAALRKSDDDVAADPEAELERLAKAHAEANRMPFAKAYDAVLQTPEGRALYGRGQRSDKPVTKSDPQRTAIEKSEAETELDEFVKGYAAKHDLTFEAAYLPATRTGDGKALFAKAVENSGHPGAQRSAALTKAAGAMRDQAHDLYDTLAKQIRKPGESYSAAYDRAMKQRPEIYNDVANTCRSIRV